MQFIKSVGVFAALASVAIAQPHGHHHKRAHEHEKRELVWVTEWVTVDPATETVAPTTTSTSTPPPPPPTTTSSADVKENEKLALPIVSSSSSTSTTVPTTTSTTSTPATSSESAPAATGTGLIIANQLDQDVYAWVTNKDPGAMQVVPAGGNLRLHEWEINPDGGGVSVKLSTTQTDAESVLQFEYTYQHPTLWWDMSSINMLLESLFVTHGFLVTNDAGCKTVTCEGGNANCKESYQHPNDVNTLSCTAQSLFTLTLAPTVAQIAEAALEIGENML